MGSPKCAIHCGDSVYFHYGHDQSAMVWEALVSIGPWRGIGYLRGSEVLWRDQPIKRGAGPGNPVAKWLGLTPHSHRNV